MLTNAYFRILQNTIRKESPAAKRSPFLNDIANTLLKLDGYKIIVLFPKKVEKEKKVLDSTISIIEKY